MASRSSLHLTEKIHQKLGVILQRESQDPRFMAVTISQIKLSSDKSHATVLFTCYLEGVDGRSLEEPLNRAAGFFGQALGRTLETRNTPRLHFVYDPGFDHAQEIDVILKSIQKQEPPPGEDS
ncbi:MAG: 30S ribosome-binding factor RbfA [Deltaproteobacteria bacterium]|nr:30S ribosome-binding factor RbfA [Deltaproteobacteria bacterium]